MMKHGCTADREERGTAKVVLSGHPLVNSELLSDPTIPARLRGMNTETHSSDTTRNTITAALQGLAEAAGDSLPPDLAWLILTQFGRALHHDADVPPAIRRMVRYASMENLVIAIAEQVEIEQTWTDTETVATHRADLACAIFRVCLYQSRDVGSVPGLAPMMTQVLASVSEIKNGSEPRR